MLGRMRVALHPADWIGRGGRSMLMIVITMVVVPMMIVVVFVWRCHLGTISSAAFSR
jgi:hypothetical protein